MKLSLKILAVKNPCASGLEWYKNNPTKSVESCVNKLLAETDNACPQRLNWANWLLSRMFTKKQCVQYAVFAAEQVIDIFEKKYSKDKRPRNAIEAAKKYLKNPLKENAAYAAYAAYAAGAASAADAAYAAYAADAADAAGAASAAGAAYAASAAYAADAAGAAYGAIKTKIINYGLSILTEAC